MIRIYYIGEVVIVTADDRLAGVAVGPGCAVDVPERLAEELVDEGVWAYERPARRTFVELDDQGPPGEALVEVDRPELQPASSLPGLGGVSAARLREAGVLTVGDVAALDDVEIGRIAATPGLTKHTLQEWRREALDRLTLR
jgi:hypothetical protein